ncbi:MAG: hypothetical protein IIA92_01495 [Chloroflexi bacterium]|nr:hypothetical protein [Chloroflexota bacterium]
MSRSLSAAISILVASSYILVLAPELLGEIEIPREAVFIGCIFGIGIFWSLSGKLTNTPLILAPAVGLLVFTNQFYFAINGDPGIDITAYNLLLTSAIVGGIVLLASKIRGQILNAIPEPVRLGINASVGTLLATTAIKSLTTTFTTDPIPYAAALGAVIGGTVLVIFYGMRAKASRDSTATSRLDPKRLLVNSYYLGSFILACALFLLIDLISGGTEVAWIPVEEIFIADNLILEGWKGITRTESFALLGYGLVILFVLLTDIPGTPFALLDKTEDKIREEYRNKAITGSFVVDGVASVGYPLLGLTPPIYYSENIVVKDFEANSAGSSETVWSGRPAILMGFACIFVAVILVGLHYAELLPGLPLLPEVLVAPILLLLSLVIISNGMISERERRPVENTPDSSQPVNSRTFQFYMPTAAAIVTTPFLGLAFGLCFACLAYIIVKLSGEPELQKEERGELWIVMSLAVVSALISVLINFA